jgi:PIN domain nuclease of toxin-antitoxin system
LTAYIDTNVAVWLAQGSLNRISPKAQKCVQTAANLLLSPVVLIELEYLYEIGRILISATDLRVKLEHEIGIRMCSLDFLPVAQMALNEKWTRDPFDRIIVAHAKANGLSPLVSADEEIKKRYSRTIW